MSLNIRRVFLLGSSALLTLHCLGNGARSQTATEPTTEPMIPLHEIVVNSRKPVVRHAQPASATNPNPAPAPAPTEAKVFAEKTATFDTARDTIFTKLGTTSYNVNHDAIAALPQGTNAPFDKVLLQAPGVSQDSAASGALHVRNEHGNVQYRINGILLPDGIAGFGQVLDTSFVGTMALITGALPAQYGLRTSALFDITTRTIPPGGGGSVGIYGGSQQTINPSFEYGNRIGQTEYFVTGRYLQNNLGIENPTPSIHPIHDDTQQGKVFAYASTFLDEYTRLSFIGGVTHTQLQIPNTPGQMPNFTAFGVGNFDSTQLNERQTESNQYAVVALQKHMGMVDAQVAYFMRNSNVHFMPDTVGDLVFNGVATDVTRQSLTQGLQADASYSIGNAHTVRGGIFVSREATQITNFATLLPVDDTGAAVDAPFSVVDDNSKIGWLAGVYLQDEWKVTNQLTLNFGVRFDQMMQFTDANQVSPRINAVYKPFDGTTFHAGYMRTFTPASQAVATPVNLALFQGTTAAPSINQQDPVLPERADVYDVGVVQQLFPGLQVGVDGYYKVAKDLIDDGQFGQALVLSGFNYDRGENIGVEFSTSYTNGNFNAYANLAFARQIATNVVSNQYLFDNTTPLSSLGGLTQFQYLQNNWIATDHSQTVTGSAGMSYLWGGTRYSANMIYGSGLRSGDANTDHLPAYAQFNVGTSREIALPNHDNFTLRFDVVNIFDTIYQIRDGSGIGVFAPQYGPRRGFFVGLSKRI